MLYWYIAKYYVFHFSCNGSQKEITIIAANKGEEGYTRYKEWENTKDKKFCELI